MNAGHFGNEVQTEASSAPAGAKSVERLDDPPALILRNAGPGIGHLYRRGWVDADTNLASFATMFNGVLNQVRHRALNRSHVGADAYGVGSINRNRTAIHDYQRGQIADYPFAD